MAAEKPTLNCPTCGKLVYGRKRADNPCFPFCSERCKLLDLGKWLSEEHRISEPGDDEREPGEGGT